MITIDLGDFVVSCANSIEYTLACFKVRKSTVVCAWLLRV